MGKPIKFEPIPEEGQDPVNPRYYTALSIYPPGEFINNKGFSVFIGGSGVGERATLAEAKSYLFDRALHECQWHIDRARKTMEHWENQMGRLIANGIARKEDDVQGK
jgi:hypothetical protein